MSKIVAPLSSSTEVRAFFLKKKKKEEKERRHKVKDIAQVSIQIGT